MQMRSEVLYGRKEYFHGGPEMEVLLWPRNGEDPEAGLGEAHYLEAWLTYH